MSKLNQILNQLEAKIDKNEMTNPAISVASVGWQIEHILLVINNIVKALQNPRVVYKWKFNFKRILLLNEIVKIPRGKIKAPKQVIPTNDFDLKNIRTQIEIAKQNIQLLETLDKNLFFEHPFLGHLKIKQTKKFLFLHSKHHLEIIEDIVRKQ